MLMGNLVVSRKRAFDQPIILACDGKCGKAWGRQLRPRDQHDDYLPDHALGVAPAEPGTWEGEDTKPLEPVHNRWCFRQCERSASCLVDAFPALKLPKF